MGTFFHDFLESCGMQSQALLSHFVRKDAPFHKHEKMLVLLETLWIQNSSNSPNFKIK